jgi:hypothetical protein
MRRSSVLRSVHVTVEFEPGEVPDRQYYSHPYRPTRVRLSYAPDHRTESFAWRVSGITITGPRVNKGDRLSTSVFVDEVLYSRAGDVEWLSALIEANTPALPAVDDLPVQAEHVPAPVDLDSLTREDT